MALVGAGWWHWSQILRQPVAAAASDAGGLLRWLGGRWTADGAEGQLINAARLVRDVQIARESMVTYRLIERLIRHHSSLAAHLPDDRRPEQMIFFVGQSRSGHSLVGSLIDAHPQATVAHEIHALKHLHAGYDLAAVVRAIKLNAHLFAQAGRSYSGYDYAVPGQHQGCYGDILVAGDKKGNGTTRYLRRHPAALEAVDRQLDRPALFINVVRDPFDNIATKARRAGLTLDEAARRFFHNVETIEALSMRVGNRLKHVYLEDLIREPTTVLADLVAWLGLPLLDDHLKQSAAIVFEQPSRTGAAIAWPSGLAAAIRRRAASHPYLERFAGSET